jgi:hypothetical protein
MAEELVETHVIRGSAALLTRHLRDRTVAGWRLVSTKVEPMGDEPPIVWTVALTWARRD